MNCLKCKDPGHCCKAFYLSDYEDSKMWTIEENRRLISKRLKEYGLPFVPVKKGKHYWIIGCTQLNEVGLCKIHPTRPDLCRKYKAGTGYLCVHSKEYIGACE